MVSQLDPFIDTQIAIDASLLVQDESVRSL